jgi:hypothetical protein
MKLTTHLQPVPSSRERGSIHPLHNTPSWRSPYLVKYRDDFILPFTFTHLLAFINGKLLENRAVNNMDLENNLNICLTTKGKQRKPVSR